MQIHANGEKYDERTSKDGRYDYTIHFDGKGWDVDCWVRASGDNHWHKRFAADQEDKAVSEFNRFE